MSNIKIVISEKLVELELSYTTSFDVLKDVISLVEDITVCKDGDQVIIKHVKVLPENFEELFDYIQPYGTLDFELKGYKCPSPDHFEFLENLDLPMSVYLKCFFDEKFLDILWFVNLTHIKFELGKCPLEMFKDYDFHPEQVTVHNSGGTVVEWSEFVPFMDQVKILNLECYRTDDLAAWLKDNETVEQVHCGSHSHFSDDLPDRMLDSFSSTNLWLGNEAIKAFEVKACAVNQKGLEALATQGTKKVVLTFQKSKLVVPVGIEVEI